jgi:uncharacterized protein YggE
MSADYNSKDVSKRDNKSKIYQKKLKFVIAVSILAIGLLIASISGSHILSATAQSSSNSDTSGKVIGGPLPAQQAIVSANGNNSAMNMPSSSGGMDNGINNSSNNTNLIPTPFNFARTLEPSTVSTSGTATTKVKPDKFSITLGVETNGTTAQEAASKNADLMAKVMAALKGLGIQDDQIGTSNYNVYPVYESRPSSMPQSSCPNNNIYPPPPECQPANVLTGYRASNSVTVTLDVAGKIDPGKVIDTAVGAGANNVDNVTFFISTTRQQEIRDSLIRDAIANAKHRADVAANAAGMKVSGVKSIDLNDVYFPVYSTAFKENSLTMNAGSAAAPTPIQPGEQEVSINVSMVFYILNNNNMGNTITASNPWSGNESSLSHTASTPLGMLSTMNNTHCTNPPNGPMIC